MKKILKLVNEKSNKDYKIIILGDLNTTDLRQYKSLERINNIMKHVFNNSLYLKNNNVIKLITDSKFKSATDPLNINMTVWSNIQCDYIFTRGITGIKPQILYPPNSDHFPLLIDIKGELWKFKGH